MSQFQNEYGSNVTRTDEYGNPVRQQTDQYGNPIAPSHTQTDQYGNPVHHPGTGGAYGTATDTGHRTTTTAGHHGTAPTAGHHGTTTTAGHHGTTTTTGPTYTTTGLHGKEQHGLGHNSSEDEVDEFGVRRKKGITEKIKEKIPGVCGQGQRDEHAMSTTTPGGHAYGHGHRDGQAMPTTTPGGAAYGYEDHREKKGIMDKIKEKLPGHN